MLNFTVGPVQSSEEIRKIGSEQVPYFRTQEFSELMFENERFMKKFAKAEENARVVFVTGSGTASMEAAIINTLTPKDKALVVNGGSFGQRFVQLCQIYDIPHDEIRLNYGETLKENVLMSYDGMNYTAFIVNMHETSTGVLYDMDLISSFCRRNDLFLIVDTISSFLADEFDMKKLGADIMITGSQKALACPPGISAIVLSQRAVDRVYRIDPKCMYLNLKDALRNGERGQTPFTPAVGILRQINARLKAVDLAGGSGSEIQRTKDLAQDFRLKIKGLPFEIFSESLSNAVTPLHPISVSANRIFLILKDEYGIWVCPNGGELQEILFRVGHIGNLTKEDNTILAEAFKDMKKRGLI